MRMRILHMDFRRRRVAVELKPGDDGALPVGLESFMRACRLRGIETIHVTCAHGVSKLQMLAVSELCARHHAVLAAQDDPAAAPDGGSPLHSSVSGDGESPGAIDYHLRLTDAGTAVERVATAAVLIGAASDLGETARAHLRLCLYELVTNSVEHGQFKGLAPEIEADIAIRPLTIVLSYRDNAKMFKTTRRKPVNVSASIKHGRKRGLGLFILNQLARSLEYQRAGGHNVTVLELAAYPAASRSRERRPVMEGITVEVVPCDQPGTVVIRPIGSIDSTGTPVVEAQIDSLIGQGNNRIVVDFSGVDFISSAGVGIFLGNVSRLRAGGGDLYFMDVPEHIQDVFDIINLGSFFVTIKDVDELSATSTK